MAADDVYDMDVLVRMAENHEDEDDADALLREFCPLDYGDDMGTSTSRKRLEFSSPIRPHEPRSVLVEKRPRIDEQAKDPDGPVIRTLDLRPVASDEPMLADSPGADTMDEDIPDECAMDSSTNVPNENLGRSLAALKCMPVSGSFVSMVATDMSGDDCRLYLRRASAEACRSRIKLDAARRLGFVIGGGQRAMLLKEPVDVLLDRIEERKIDQGVRDAEQSGIVPASRPKSQSRDPLWVSKYQPQAFLELISDSKINREVLQWVQAWDPVVFDRAPRASPSAASPAGKPPLSQKRSSPFPSHNRSESSTPGRHGKGARPPPWIPHNPGLQRGPSQSADDHRPWPRILLLAGPPGCGKTTLAHICAKKAGYNVFEINASDDRSGAKLRQQITMAVSMQPLSVPGRPDSGKPNLIVIDEIDGAADSDAVRDIIDIANDHVDLKVPGRRAPTASPHRLQRPIICICNDLFAKVLRPLRPIALVYRLSPPTTSALCARASAICLKETLKISNAALRYICELSNNDLRSVLQSLQLVALRGRSGKPLSRDDIKDIVASSKDTSSDLLTVLKLLLQLGTSLDRVLACVSAFDDTARLVDGAFESYVAMPYSDPTLDKTSCAADWFSVDDALSTQILSRQQYSLGGYSGMSCAAAHIFCRVRTVPKIPFPKEAFEYRRNRAERLDVLSRFLSSCHHRYTETVSATDLIPYLTTIVTPRCLRAGPVVGTLVSAEDAKLVDRVVRVMLHYGLSYSPVTSQTKGETTLQLSPNIDLLCTFTAAEGSIARYSMPLQWQQRIAQAVDAHLATSMTAPVEQPAAPPALAAPPANPKPKAWAGSFLKDGESRAAASRQNVIRFHHNEGFTQAVRRPVKIHDFLKR
ncbi:unnamed protein product (mitochondrion) [Plasmodiophora brassicae]|uniref:AAA+ ATPase domain-containing protein n=2 Tax=Plasmodiophora brassicae TaxID=37360 RepID=A0A3P3Y9H5_PLABS|nr:unnamed protein product [Plasmodiophora brassicae]